MDTVEQETVQKESIVEKSWFRYLQIIPVVMLLPIVISCVWSLIVFDHPHITDSVLGIIWFILAFAMPISCIFFLRKKIEWAALTALFVALNYLLCTIIPLCWGMIAYENELSPIVSKTTDVSYYGDFKDLQTHYEGKYVAEAVPELFPKDLDGLENVEYLSYCGPLRQCIRLSFTVSSVEKLKEILDSMSWLERYDDPDDTSQLWGNTAGNSSFLEVKYEGERFTFMCYYDPF